ncbi:hypothetical protein GCM10009528_01140 [Kineococcus aurantiacus]
MPLARQAPSPCVVRVRAAGATALDHAPDHAPDDVPGDGLGRAGDWRVAGVELPPSATGSGAAGDLVEVLAAPDVRLVTLGPLDGAGGATAHDVLVRALARRRALGTGPFTVLHLDPLPRGAARTRQAVLELARAQDPGLAAWIARHGAFPGSVPDPAPPQATGARWLVEDAFCAGHPPPEALGITLVPSTAPWEALRRRLDQGARWALGAVSGSTGGPSPAQTLSDPCVRGFLRGFLDEFTGTAPGVPDDHLARYRAAVVTDLAAATGPLEPPPVPRLLRETVLPTLRRGLDRGHPVGHLALAAAAWLATSAGRSGGPGDDLDATALVRDHPGGLGPLVEDVRLTRVLQGALDRLAAGALGELGRAA